MARFFSFGPHPTSRAAPLNHLVDWHQRRGRGHGVPTTAISQMGHPATNHSLHQANLRSVPSSAETESATSKAPPRARFFAACWADALLTCVPDYPRSIVIISALNSYPISRGFRMPTPQTAGVQGSEKCQKPRKTGTFKCASPGAIECADPPADSGEHQNLEFLARAPLQSMRYLLQSRVALVCGNSGGHNYDTHTHTSVRA